MAADTAKYGMPLTPKEKECLQWTTMLGRCALAASVMGIAEGTAKAHLLSVRTKLGTNTTLQAAYLALKKGLIE